MTIAELAGRRRRSTARARASCPRRRPRRREGCVGRLGLESFHAPQLIAHAAHVRVDRETGVVRVLQVAAVHDCGAHPQPDRSRRPGLRRRRDGDRAGAVARGRSSTSDGRQRNPHLLDYKLVTASDAPQIDIAWIETDTPNAGPKGSKGVGEPPCVPTAGAIANAIAKVVGSARAAAADDARARVGGAAAVSATAVRDRDHGRRGARGARRRRAPGCRRHRSRRRRPPGQGAAARRARRDPPRRRAARNRRGRRTRCGSARS